MELPYERFMQYGPASLTGAELIAVILRTGAAGTSAVSVGEQVLSCAGGDGASLSALYDLTMEELLSIRGIGEVKAVKLLCLREIARRLAREPHRERPDFSSPSYVARRYMEEMRHERQERTVVLHLDNRLRLIGEEVITIGSSTCALVSPRDIFRRALRKGADRIILLHNHPSGDPTPSDADIRATAQLRRAGEMLGIRLEDHIVIGDLCYCSMRESGYMEVCEGAPNMLQ